MKGLNIPEEFLQEPDIEEYEDTLEQKLDFPEKIKIKTIVFDLGGVVFTDGSMLAIKKIKRALRLKNEDLEILEECFDNEPGSMGRLIRLGLITFDEFVDKFAKKLNLPKSKKNKIRDLWFSSYVPNYLMKKIIERLSKNYRLVIFSGNVKERIKYLKKRYHKIFKHFDDAVYSFDYQKNKRDLSFYRELLNHIKCDPSEAIFIDDSWNNIERAESLGLNGIHFSYTEQLLDDFEQYGIELKR